MHRIDYPKNHNLGRIELDEDEYQIVGRVKGLEILTYYDTDAIQDDDIEIFVINPKDFNRHGYKLAMEISLSRSYTGAYHVDMVRTDRKYRGFGIAPKVYAKIIKVFGLTLQAGTCQSPGGRYIWNTLANITGISIIGRHGRRGAWHYLESSEDGELVTTEDVSPYDTQNNFYVFAYAG